MAGGWAGEPDVTGEATMAVSVFIGDWLCSVCGTGVLVHAANIAIAIRLILKRNMFSPVFARSLLIKMIF
jgi:hypothetical protein